MIQLALIVVASIALVVILGAVAWLLVLRPWLDGVRYSRSNAGHRRDVPAADPFWGNVTWDDELADFAPADPCDDDDCATMIHTGQMPALTLLPAMSGPAWDQEVQTVNLPSWETEDLPGQDEDTGVLTGEIVPAPPGDAQPAACDTDTLLYLAARKTEFARELAALAAWGRELTGAVSS